MSASESDFQPPSRSSSPNEEEDHGTYNGSRACSVVSENSRKRKRVSISVTNGQAGEAKAGLRYSDGYRTLFNQEAESLAARFDCDFMFVNHDARIGASRWTKKEKIMLFAALTRLGRHDTAGIAKAVGSKSISEVHELLSLLRKSAATHFDAKIELRDIPAAIEIGPECEQALGVAGEALAWYQERFEAKVEEAKYGQYWLLNTELADKLKAASDFTRSQSRSVSAKLPGAGDIEAEQHAAAIDEIPQILQDIPEANLLDVAKMLELSRACFMNGSPSAPSIYPHWSALASPIASEPAMYRTVLRDLYALVVSLTKRLMQAATAQAVSRIRSQAWRGERKAARPFVKRRDVSTAVDMLRLPRDASEYWPGLARRCRLRVQGTDKEELSWTEVEKLLHPERMTSPTQTEDEGQDSDESSRGGFKTRAARSGTPRPARDSVQPTTDDESVFEEVISDESGHDNSSSDADSQDAAGIPESQPPTGPTIEEFDHQASLQEESGLWTLLGVEPPVKRDEMPKVENETDAEEATHNQYRGKDTGDWRQWTEYHAEWELHSSPVPEAAFVRNRKSPSHGPSRMEGLHSGNSDGSTDAEGNPDARSTKRRRMIQSEIPIRGARAYAALQERCSSPYDGNIDENMTYEDDADVPAVSVEVPDIGDLRASSSSEDHEDEHVEP